MSARALAAAVLLLAALARADEVPAPLQAQLLAKMSAYIVGFAPGQDGAVKVVVVHGGSAEAPSRGAQAIAAALTQVGQFGGARVEAKLVALSDAKSLRATLTSEKPQFVYVAPELASSAAAGVVEAASTGTAVTVSPVPEHVKLGVMLGFELVEARPQLLVNLKQAHKQNVDFHSGLLRHAVIVDR